MDTFLFDNFPLSYSRIYKALLQHKGRERIPKELGKILSGHKIEKLFEPGDEEYLPRDVYFGLRDLAYLENNGYAHIFQPLLADKDPLVLKGSIEAIVLQVQESKRWEKRYGSTDQQFDLVLAIPRWSRVVIMSTSEIQPLELVSQINQFDKITLENYHLYEFFNKLHGVTGRKVILSEQHNIDKAKNFGKLNFLFRTIEDIKKIAKCKNMRLFTTVPDINGKPRVGFYFAVTCKVSEVNDVMVKDGTGIDPYTFKLVCSDEFGSLEMRLGSHIFSDSIRKKYLEQEINEFFGSKIKSCSKFEHPVTLKKFEGYFLIIGNWFLGDDTPNISYILALSPDINFLKYQVLGYMNTRKKVSFEKIKEKWEEKLKGVVDISENLKTDTNKEWGYYKEEFWDEDIFKYVVDAGFKNTKPPFYEMVRRDISVQRLQDWTMHTATYFRINDFTRRLYFSEDPSSEFEKVYAELIPIRKSPEILKEGIKEEIKQIPSVRPVNSWVEVKKLVEPLRKTDYTIDDIFSWGNGGRQLGKKWLNATLKNVKTTDELISALAYISQATGTVFLPDGLN